MALFATSLWADTYYVICQDGGITTSGNLTSSSNSNQKLSVIKYNGSTYAVSTDITFADFPTAKNGKYKQQNISNILTSSNWETGSGSSYATGPKFTKNTSATIKLGSLTASKITFLGYPGGNTSSITIAGNTKSNTTKAWFTHEVTGSFTGDVTVSISNDNDIYGIFVIETAAATKYTVTYSAGTGSVKEGKSLPTQADVAAGTVITLASADNLEKEDKEFDGWLCNINSTKYAAGASYTMTAAPTTFTAQWRDPAPKYTVTYVLNGPSGDAPTETSKAAGDVFNLAAAPSWTGHAFDGWLCSADAAVKAAGSSYTMTAVNTTFTAQWHEVDCKIYSLTGGIGSAEVTADASNAEVTQSLLKLASTNARIKLTPGEGTFKAGDVITISGYTGSTSKKFGVYVKNAAGSSNIATVEVVNLGECIASATLSADAEYVLLGRKESTTMNILTCEIHRSCAEGTAAGLSYAVTSIDKMTGDAAFTNALTNTNSLVIAGYGTSDAAVATVASNGQVTIVGDGTATITAYSAVQTKAGTLYAAGSASYTVTVTSADDDATLSALSVSGLTLSPAFAAATEDYTVTKAYGAADPVVGNVTATPTSGSASAEVVWDSENHKFVITVTAGDNTTKKTYTITVNEAEAPKSLSRVLFSNGFDAFIDNTNHTVKAYYLAGTSAPTATTITAGAGTAGGYAEGKIIVTGEDKSTVDYIVTLEAVTPNTTTVAASADAGEFAGNEAWVKNGLLESGSSAGYDNTNKRYVIRRPKDDQTIIAGHVRTYFFVGNASKFIMTIGGNKPLKYAIDGATPVEVNVTTLEIALTKGNHMIEIVSNQNSGDCYLLAPKLVERYTVTYAKGDEGADGTMTDPNSPYAAGDEVTLLANAFIAPIGQEFDAWVVTETVSGNPVAVSEGKFIMPAADVTVTATFSAINYIITCSPAENGSVSAKATANYGEVVTLTVSPNDDYVATNVSYNGTTIIPVENVYSFIMPAEAVTVTATFAKSSTAVENVESSAKAVKTLKNGVLIIEKNGKKYNIIGSEIR